MTEMKPTVHNVRERPAAGKQPLRTDGWGAYLNWQSIDIEMFAKSLVIVNSMTQIAEVHHRGRLNIVSNVAIADPKRQ